MYIAWPDGSSDDKHRTFLSAQVPIENFRNGAAAG
jgi:hypothetical protein